MPLSTELSHEEIVKEIAFQITRRGFSKGTERATLDIIANLLRRNGYEDVPNVAEWRAILTIKQNQALKNQVASLIRAPEGD